MDGFDRRSVQQGIGGLESLSVLGKYAVEGVDAERTGITVPEAARSVEAGEELFGTKGAPGGPVITATASVAPSRTRRTTATSIPPQDDR